MFDLALATKATERDLGAIIGRLDSLADDDWNAPVRCAGWRVTDLAAHVAAAARGQAEALRRAAAGTAEITQFDLPGERAPAALLAALRGGQDDLLTALRDLPGHVLGGSVPLPFGLLPAAVALQIIPLEYGFHHNDLEWALGNLVPLSEEMSSALLGILPGLLPMLAAGSPVHAPGIVPAMPVSFRLAAPGARLLASHAQDAWSIVPDSGDTPVSCAISGDNSSLALFVMGRVTAGYPGIAVTDFSLAQTFKRYFPGP